MGTIVLVGHSAKDVTLEHTNFVQILRKQLTVVGSWNSDKKHDVDDWQESIDAIANGTLDPEKMITHAIALEDADKAFNIIGERKEFYNKIVLVM